MPEPLEVDFTGLFMSADHLDMYEAEHTRAHQAANADIEAASSGWVGSPGEAIKGTLSHLQAVASHISNELSHHRDSFRHIGTKCDTIDQDAAAEIIGIRQNL
ncbi:hypothetical protein [Mycolicibacterium goodii]|uniref:ESX-1 secretion-associated protein n=1 Tax=Mycolicibacterium goodii TaxID=134601 RepID=A0A0K0X5W9_MYCGD|nr:hypothetical protein AFA91_13905 [Mycolicibacterium goodii]